MKHFAPDRTCRWPADARRARLWCVGLLAGLVAISLCLGTPATSAGVTEAPGWHTLQDRSRPGQQRQQPTRPGAQEDPQPQEDGAIPPPEDVDRPQLPPTREIPPPAEIDRAIDRAKEYLYEQMNADGTWERSPQPLPEAQLASSYAVQDSRGGQWGGRTAIVVAALLAAGEEVSDPRLVRAVEFLKTADLRGTYAVGLRLVALTYIPMDAQARATIARDADLLIRTVQTEGAASGHWDYNLFYRERTGIYSHSRSKYAVLGLWAAQQMGYDVPPRLWQLVDQGWRRNQNRTGAWRYQHPESNIAPHDTPGMTAAAVASLFITTDFLTAERARGCNGNIVDPNVAAGIDWLAENFHLLDPRERYRRDFPYVTLYAVERVGVASGLRYIGAYDWYAHGVHWLLDNQRRDGAWSGGSRGSIEAELTGVVDTSFALLFLVRGRSPVMANKLAYTVVDRRGNETVGPWAQRPRDLFNLAAFTGTGLERELHWQIVDQTREVREWHDAPILYIAGSDPLNLTPETREKLRRFALEGGLIVFNADCGRRPYVNSVNQLAAEIFPEYAFRNLDADHPLFNMQFPLGQQRRVPQIMGLSNGARELMLLIPNQDLGRDWQTGARQRRAEPAFQMGANIFGYAIGRTNFRFKGDLHLVQKDEAARTDRSVTVGRVRYDGNWDPEPFGWEQLAAVANNDYSLEVSVREVDLADGAPDDVDVLHLTGTGDFRLDDDQQDALRKFVEGGGTLLIDAAGGSGAFASAAERELQRLFPDEAAQLTQPLPAGHDVYSREEGMPELEVRYRLEALQRLGNVREPRLRAIERDGRLAVVYSAEDLSAGLVGMHTAGIFGYHPETAAALVARVLRAAADE